MAKITKSIRASFDAATAGELKMGARSLTAEVAGKLRTLECEEISIDHRGRVTVLTSDARVMQLMPNEIPRQGGW